MSNEPCCHRDANTRGLSTRGTLRASKSVKREERGSYVVVEVDPTRALDILEFFEFFNPFAFALNELVPPSTLGDVRVGAFAGNAWARLQKFDESLARVRLGRGEDEEIGVAVDVVVAGLRWSRQDPAERARTRNEVVSRDQVFRDQEFAQGLSRQPRSATDSVSRK